jgi:hypothetical protein
MKPIFVGEGARAAPEPLLFQGRCRGATPCSKPQNGAISGSSFLGSIRDCCAHISGMLAPSTPPQESEAFFTYLCSDTLIPAVAAVLEEDWTAKYLAAELVSRGQTRLHLPS